MPEDRPIPDACAAAESGQRIYSYVAYGLHIGSMLPLPELLPAAGEPEVVLRVAKVDGLPPEVRSGEGYCQAEAETVHLFWPEAGAFQISGGREIVVEPAPAAEERVVRLYLLGPVLAMLLFQRGRLILHASAVAIDGAAVAFLGASGWGKSTTAAAFHAHGYGVVADDVAAVQTGSGRPLIFPGFPQLKLCPDALLSLGHRPETLPQLHPDEGKRGRCVIDGFCREPLPLRSLYVLAEGRRLEIEPLQGRETFVELLRHSYAVRLLYAIGAAAQFKQCASVVGAAPARRLKRPRSLQRLPDLVRLVEQDLGRQDSPARQALMTCSSAGLLPRARES